VLRRSLPVLLMASLPKSAVTILFCVIQNVCVVFVHQMEMAGMAAGNKWRNGKTSANGASSGSINVGMMSIIHGIGGIKVWSSLSGRAAMRLKAAHCFLGVNLCLSNSICARG